MLRSLLALGPRTVHCLLVAATASYLLVALYMEPVSYTHLTLPTNREV